MIDTPNTLGNRLEWAIKQKMERDGLSRKISNAKLAEVAEVSRTAVGHWYSGLNGIQAKQARPLGEFLGVSSYWLETGEGQPNEGEIDAKAAWEQISRTAGDKLISVAHHAIEGYRAARSSGTRDEVRQDTSEYKDVTIPQFKDVGGAMGHGVFLRDQPGEFHALHVSPDWIDKNIKNYTSKANLAVVTGFGDSMRGMFNPGDPLIVDRGINTVEFDAVYFFRVGDQGFIKRLQRIPGEGLVAISQNKDYRDWTLKPDMDFEVFARVIKVWESTDL